MTDVVLVNKEILEKTINSIKSNWQIIFLGIVYSVLGMVASILVGALFTGPLGLARGFILALVESSIISSYIFVLYNVISYNRFRWRDVKNGFTYFIWKVYAVLFIFYLGSIILSFIGSLLGGIIFVYLMLGISILVFIILNPIPEALYVKTYNPWDTVLYCLEFMRGNWLNWIIPNIVFFLLLFIISGGGILNVFSIFNNFTLAYGMVVIVRYLLASVILSFGMIYRGHLFTLLSTSTRRKRMFMRKV